MCRKNAVEFVIKFSTNSSKFVPQLTQKLFTKYREIFDLITTKNLSNWWLNFQQIIQKMFHQKPTNLVYKMFVFAWQSASTPSTIFHSLCHIFFHQSPFYVKFLSLFCDAWLLGNKNLRVDFQLYYAWAIEKFCLRWHVKTWNRSIK